MPSVKPTSAASAARAARNVARCLRAMEQSGEAGLQKELDRIYPGTTAEAEPTKAGLDFRVPGAETGVWIGGKLAKDLLPTKVR